MLHKEFWGILFLAFVAWVFVAGTPDERIANACRPIKWTGNVVVSLSALAMPDPQEKVNGYFNKIEYGCRYMTWRLFYQEAYNAWLAQQNANKGVAPKTNAVTAPAATVVSDVPPAPAQGQPKPATK